MAVKCLFKNEDEKREYFSKKKSILLKSHHSLTSAEEKINKLYKIFEAFTELDETKRKGFCFLFIYSKLTEPIILIECIR